jgi:hypothetical protein
MTSQRRNLSRTQLDGNEAVREETVANSGFFLLRTAIHLISR